MYGIQKNVHCFHLVSAAKFWELNIKRHFTSTVWRIKRNSAKFLPIFLMGYMQFDQKNENLRILEIKLLGHFPPHHVVMATLSSPPGPQAISTFL